MRHNKGEAFFWSSFLRREAWGCIKKCRTEEEEVEEATGRETTTTIETIIINAIRVVIDHHHHHGCVLFAVCDFYVLLSLLLSVVFQREREREIEFLFELPFVCLRSLCCCLYRRARSAR